MIGKIIIISNSSNHHSSKTSEKCLNHHSLLFNFKTTSTLYRSQKNKPSLYHTHTHIPEKMITSSPSSTSGDENPLRRVVFAHKVIQFAADIFKDPLSPIILGQVTSSFDEAVRDYNCAAECWRNSIPKKALSSEKYNVKSNKDGDDPPIHGHQLNPSWKVQQLLFLTSKSDSTLWILRQLVLAGCHAEIFDSKAKGPYATALTTATFHALSYSVTKDTSSNYRTSLNCLKFLLNDCRVSPDLNISVVVEKSKSPNNKDDADDDFEVIGQLKSTITPAVKSNLRKIAPNIKSQKGTPLMIACAHYDLKLLKLLWNSFEKKKKKNATTASLLINAGSQTVDIDQTCVIGSKLVSPLSLACSSSGIGDAAYRRGMSRGELVKERKQVIKFLVEECNASVTPPGADFLFNAAAFSAKEEELLMKSINNNDDTQQEEGDDDDDETLVEYLLRNGAHIASPENQGAQQRTTGMMIRSLTHHNRTKQAFHAACSAGSERAIRALLKYARAHFGLTKRDDENENNNNNDDDNKDSAAPSSNNTDLLRTMALGKFRTEFLEVFADKKCTPLHHAVSSLNLVAVKILVEEEHARLNLGDSRDNTPLHAVLSCDSISREKVHLEITRILLQAGAPVTLKNKQGHTPGQSYLEWVNEEDLYSNVPRNQEPEVKEMLKLLRHYGAI